ncbi:MAG: DUF58 domain-containing protein [Planctomycetota bacterium]
MTRLERFDVRSRKLFPGKLRGERRSKQRGQSVEFEDYRNYVPGDDLRFIDWNVYARLERLFIKIFLEEEDLALHIALDASASMDTGTPNKLLCTAQLAMALGYIGLVKQNRVGLSVFGRPGVAGVARLPDQRGRHQTSRLASFLLDEVWRGRDGGSTHGGAPGPGAGFNDALTTIARMRVGKGVMVVLSDFLVDDGYQAGLRALGAAGGYDTYCLQVLSPSEVDPERESEAGVAGDLRLTDVETGRAAEVTLTAPVIKRYKERLQAYCAELGSYCLAREMTHQLVRSDVEIERLLLDTLRRHGMVG